HAVRHRLRPQTPPRGHRAARRDPRGPPRSLLTLDHLRRRTMRVIASCVPCGWIHCDIPWEIRTDPPAGDTRPTDPPAGGTRPTDPPAGGTRPPTARRSLSRSGHPARP